MNNCKKALIKIEVIKKLITKLVSLKEEDLEDFLKELNYKYSGEPKVEFEEDEVIEIISEVISKLNKGI